MVTETQGLHLSICGRQAFPHRHHPSTEKQVHVSRLSGVALVEGVGAEEQPSGIVYISSKYIRCPGRNSLGSCIDPKSVRSPSRNPLGSSPCIALQRQEGSKLKSWRTKSSPQKAQTMDEEMSDRGSSLGIIVHTWRALEPGNVCFHFTEIVLRERRERNRDRDNNICE